MTTGTTADRITLKSSRGQLPKQELNGEDTPHTGFTAAMTNVENVEYEPAVDGLTRIMDIAQEITAWLEPLYLAARTLRYPSHMNQLPTNCVPRNRTIRRTTIPEDGRELLLLPIHDAGYIVLVPPTNVDGGIFWTWAMPQHTQEFCTWWDANCTRNNVTDNPEGDFQTRRLYSGTTVRLLLRFFGAMTSTSSDSVYFE